MNYMQLSNIDATKWTEVETKILLDLCCNDDRVESITSISERSENGRVQFNVKMDLGHGETVNEILSVGKLAGLLYQSRYDHAENKKRNAQLEDTLKDLASVELQSNLTYIEKKISQYETNISSVLHVINCLKFGLRIRDNLKIQNALQLIEWNQNHGTGNWFIFTDNARFI